MLPYIIHTSILLAASFILYWFLLRKETFYKVNRYFLLATIALSLLIPAIQIPADFSIHKPEISSVIPVVETTNTHIQTQPIKASNSNTILSSNPVEESINTGVAPKADSSSETINYFTSLIPNWNLSKWIWSVYLIGIALFGINFLIQFVLLLFRKSKLEFIEDGSFTIYELTDDTAPFSFLHWIFINPGAYDLDTFNQILAHEKIHVQQYHYIDKLVIELLVIALWFNPFVWMYRKAVSNNLEFLTDNEMLEKGTEKEHYQMSLLKVSVPQHALDLTTNYNESFLSERIRMMSAKRSSAKSSWKYLLVIPMIGLSMSVLNAIIPVELTENLFLESTEKSTTDADDNLAQSEVKQKLNSNSISKKGSKENQQIPESELTDNDEKKSVIENENNSLIGLNSTTKFENKTKDIVASTSVIDLTRIVEQKESNDNTIDMKKESIKVKGSDIASVEFKIDENEINLANRDTKIEKKSCVEKGINKKGCCNNSDEGQQFKDLKPGMYKAKIKADQLCYALNYSVNSHSDSWFINTCEDINVVSNFSIGDEVTFHIKRNAGTLTFNGDLYAGKYGYGVFDFEVNPDYIAMLKSKGINGYEDQDLFNLYVHNVTKDWIEAYSWFGLNSTIDDLIALNIHEVSRTDMKDYHDIFANADITPNVDDMVAMKIHGVNKTLAFSVLKFDSDADIDDIVSVAIHGFDNNVINALNDHGFKNVDADVLTAMSIHGVQADDIIAYSDAGYDKNNPKSLIEFGIHGVKPDRLAKYSKMNIGSISEDDMVAFEIHGVTPEYIQGFLELGIDGVNPNKIVEAAIHGVSVSDVRKMNELGFDEADLRDLIEFAIHGVDSYYISELQKAGINNLSVSNLVEGRIHGVTGKYISELKALGVTGISFKEAKNGKIHGVSPRFVKRARERGYNPKTLEEYIDLKIHGF